MKFPLISSNHSHHQFKYVNKTVLTCTHQFWWQSDEGNDKILGQIVVPNSLMLAIRIIPKMIIATRSLISEINIILECIAMLAIRTIPQNLITNIK